MGKNLIGFRTMFMHENITPFIFFGEGYDFSDSYTNSKLFLMNEFFELNRIFVFKQEGDYKRNKNTFSPVSMFAQEKECSIEELIFKFKTIVDVSFGYYIF
ncbi:restriction endonuclease ['Camptotheca acuminata' phytoplasma]|uniref:restriction endonuclease n=1 Tax='Camptotheca acuminata' phytoplasma TaxID=3239192 RepID=UPI00351A2AAC